MQPCYCIIDGQSNEQIPASIQEATATDFERTAREHWQTDWRTDYIQDTTLEKYALELDATKELVGLAAYRDMPEGVLVYVEYMESAPSGNPTLSKTRKYAGIGAALLAFGIQLPIDYGYGGAIYLKAKTTQLREHYMRNYGAIPFSRFDPFLLLIDGAASASSSRYFSFCICQTSFKYCPNNSRAASPSISSRNGSNRLNGIAP